MIYDLIIIGGGPAGLTAGLYAARARLTVLLFEKTVIGGNAILTDIIENYPGFVDGITGFDLIENMKKQAEKFGLKIIFDEVLKLEIINKIKLVKTKNQEYQARCVIIATGSSHKELNIPGEVKFKGKGVSYCATCDGPFYRDKTIAVIGGGDSAIEEALFLTKFAKKVYVIHRRDTLRATKILQERAFANNKIEFILNSVATEILGNEKVESVKIKNNKTTQESEIKIDGIFILIGYVPNTEFVKNILELTSEGLIKTNANMQTSIPGIFACGDCIDKRLKQVVTAAGDGANAAFNAEKYIERNYE